MVSYDRHRDSRSVDKPRSAPTVLETEDHGRVTWLAPAEHLLCLDLASVLRVPAIAPSTEQMLIKAFFVLFCFLWPQLSHFTDEHRRTWRTAFPSSSSWSIRFRILTHVNLTTKSHNCRHIPTFIPPEWWNQVLPFRGANYRESHPCVRNFNMKYAVVSIITKDKSPMEK